MKLPILLILAALAAPVALATRQETAERQEPVAAEHAPLADAMDGMKANLKGLATTFRDASKRDACLAHVVELQRHALAAKALSPSNLLDQPEARRAAHQEAFRRDMNALLQILLALEIDVLDGDQEAVWEKVSGSLFKLREASHEKYQ